LYMTSCKNNILDLTHRVQAVKMAIPLSDGMTVT